MEKEIALKILNILSGLYPDAKTQLNYKTPFELLVAVMLSAQCTDKRVNAVTAELFKSCNTPESFANVPPNELEKLIFSCGFYRNKAKNIISASKSIIENFDGKVPETLEGLMSLDGVGRKTANVLYSVAFGGDAVAVDTHVYRVAGRIGLADGGSVLDTETRLMETIPKSMWSKSHHLLIFHGRNICKAAKPLCRECPVSPYCRYFIENNKIK